MSSKEFITQARYRALSDNLADYPALYARQQPKRIALVEHDTGESQTWQQFDTFISAVATELLALGLRKGDVIATQLPFTKEHVILMYAAFRAGLVIAPLDLRLRSGEIQSCLEKIKPAVFLFFGVPGNRTFANDIAALMDAVPGIPHWLQMCRSNESPCAGATDARELFLSAFLAAATDPAAIHASASEARGKVSRRDPCLIIFTTGSTGSPKPALLCHENILVQNLGLVDAFDITANDRMLVNLPPSHVGGTTEQLATIMYAGGTAVLLHVFDPQKSLNAIQAHGVTMLGQIPALFGAEWRLSTYADADLSSLRFAIYGGQAVSVPFLQALQRMAPHIGSGLGLTELAGFCTFTKPDASAETLAAGLGHPSPLCPLTIRKPMHPDGSAGEECALGEVGEICFSGPQVFLGYLGEPEATRRTISTDGICYTGDLGSYDKEAGLRFAGRAKLLIKPKGFQVFPEDVERVVLERLRNRATAAAAVGVPHERFTEGIMLFVESADPSLTAMEVAVACRELASYARPSHIEIVPPGTLPLNRVAKTDYLALRKTAEERAMQLRAAGQWDCR